MKKGSKNRNSIVPRAFADGLTLHVEELGPETVAELLKTIDDPILRGALGEGRSLRLEELSPEIRVEIARRVRALQH
jgi:hypothetical protein